MANYTVDNSTSNTFGGAQQSLTVNVFKTIALMGNGSSNATSGSPSGGAPSPYVVRRGKIYDILVGTNTTPADNFITWDMGRMTAMASSQTSPSFVGALTSASSLFSLDNADGLANSFMAVNSTSETNLVYSNSVWSVGVNQRASYRWVAAPGSEFVVPAVSSAGLGLRMISGGYTGTGTTTVLYQEQ